MKIVDQGLLKQIYGGAQLTCEEALIKDELDFDFDLDPPQYCTKAQFTRFALGMVDLLYAPDGHPSEEQTLALIRGLNL